MDPIVLLLYLSYNFLFYTIHCKCYVRAEFCSFPLKSVDFFFLIGNLLVKVLPFGRSILNVLGVQWVVFTHSG